METCIIACWDFIHDPDNIDTQPYYEDELEPEDVEGADCVIHGWFPGEKDCPRCGINQGVNSDAP